MLHLVRDVLYKYHGTEVIVWLVSTMQMNESWLLLLWAILIWVKSLNKKRSIWLLRGITMTLTISGTSSLQDKVNFLYIKIFKHVVSCLLKFMPFNFFSTLIFWVHDLQTTSDIFGNILQTSDSYPFSICFVQVFEDIVAF